MTSEDLIAGAVSKMRKEDPYKWDSNVLDWIHQSAAVYEIDEKEVPRIWREAKKKVEASYPDLWVRYEKTVGLQIDFTPIPWEEIRFIKGTEDGENYSLMFDVAGTIVTIECDYMKLKTPDYILDRLEFGSKKLIDCPYTLKRNKSKWKAGVVFRWLEKSTMRHADNVSRYDTLMDIIYDFASKPIWKSPHEDIFSQSREPIKDGDTIFIPITGLRKYVQKQLGRDTADKFIIHALLEVGAKGTRKGRKRNTFYAINEEDLATIRPREREDDKNPIRSEGYAPSGWDGFSDSVRKEEHTGLPAEDGLAIAIADGSPTHNDDSRGSVQLSESDEGEQLDELPF